MTRDLGAVGLAAEWIALGLEAAGLFALGLGTAITSLAFLRRGLAGGVGWADPYRR